MLNLEKLTFYTEAEALASIRSFENKKVFRIQTGNSRFYTLQDYSAVMTPLILRVKLMLQLQFTKVEFDYIDKKSGFSYFAYIPATGVLLDYFESPWHRGPRGITRSFNPANSEDVEFKNKYGSKYHNQSTWMYRAKALTWGGSDYRKLCYSNFNRLPYFIYWSIGSIESIVDPEVIQYSKQLMLQQNINIKLQSILDLKLIKLIKDYNKEHTKPTQYISRGAFELFDSSSSLLSSLVS